VHTFSLFLLSFINFGWENFFFGCLSSMDGCIVDMKQSKAKEMVILAEKMRVRLLTGQASTVEEEGVGTNQEMQDWMLSVGITSPVTKESAGALYHQQLSRQVHIFSSTLSMYVGFWVSVLQMFPYWKAELKSSVMSQALCRCKLEERFPITLSF
jgi:ESCRT-II complex subunit VPS36